MISIATTHGQLTTNTGLGSIPHTASGPTAVQEWHKRLQMLPATVAQTLTDIAAAGGTLQAMGGKFDHAERLGLVAVETDGGGWGFLESATLTNAGRTLLGLDLIEPKQSYLRDKCQSILHWIKARRS